MLYGTGTTAGQLALGISMQLHACLILGTATRMPTLQVQHGINGRQYRELRHIASIPVLPMSFPKQATGNVRNR